MFGTCSNCAGRDFLNKEHLCRSCFSKPLTTKPVYYILEVDTLVEEEYYDSPHQPGLKAYSVIKIDENGAHEVDRAYRSVKEALRAWPEAVPPANN